MKVEESKQLFWKVGNGKTWRHFGAYSICLYEDDNEVLLAILPKTEKAYENWFALGKAMNENDDGIEMTFPESIKYVTTPQWVKEIIIASKAEYDARMGVISPFPPGF